MPTKFVPPAVTEHVVARPRVTACFAAAVGSRLTIVTGAPGMGKTAAVREWARGLDRRVAWLTADAEDNDVREFRRDVVAAIGHVAPEMPTRFDDIREIDEPLVLVVDDFQVVASVEVVAALQTLLERKPGSLHVVVASRSDPPLPLARWRARGELHEVREAQLRFRPDEARAYLAMYADEIALDEDAIATLVQRTEGWIAGLQLAVISLRTSDDPATFITRFGGTDRFIADFLLDDVLDHQPDDIRELLLDTSVLDDFDAALCAELTGRHDAERQLRRVEAANLFLVRLDDAGTQLRYHTLFRDLRRSELHNRSPERARALRQRAAALVVQRGDRVAAVGLLADAGDDDAAFELAIPREVELDPARRSETRAGLNLLRESFVAADRERVLRFADALLSAGCIEEAAGWLTRVGAAPGRADDDEHAVAARLDAVWSRLYAANGEAELVIRRANRALATHDALLDDPMFTGLELELARAWLLEGSARQADRRLRALELRTRDPLVSEVAIPSLRARIAADAGRLRDAEATARRALRFAMTLDATHHPAVLDALLGIARVLYERDDTAGARDAIDAALDLASELSSTPYLVLARVAETRILSAERGIGFALEHLQDVSSAFDGPLASCLVDTIGSLDAELSLLAGDAERASRRVATLPVTVGRVVLAADVDLSSGDLPSARERLDALEPLTLVDSVRVELLRSVATDDIARQRRHVAIAANLAAPEGLRRPFLDRGPRIGRAARSLATSAEMEPLTRRFLESVVDLPVVTSDPRLVEPLTERERSVLRYLTTSLDYHDIATELLISANTLKTHVASIHRKLGASSRAQAVRQAEQLGLLRHR